MAAILTFQVDVDGFLSNDPLKRLMPIFTLVSSTKLFLMPNYSTEVVAILKNGRHLEISSSCGWLIVKWPTERLLVPIFMPVSPNKSLYHLNSPLRCRPSWKMATILKFQMSLTIFSWSDPWRLLMPIFMLVSPNKPLYHLNAPPRWRPSWKMAAIWFSWIGIITSGIMFLPDFAKSR